MNKNRNYILVGLIGNIGSGKSFVRKLFEQKHIICLDADEIVHKLYQPREKVYDILCQNFGEKILDADKKIDRKVLKTILFTDKKVLDFVEKIVFEHVNKYITQFLQNLSKEKLKENPIVIYEATKMVESGFIKQLDFVILVDCDNDVRFKRLKESRNLSDKQIKEILDKQLSTSENIKYADFIIYNNYDLKNISNRNCQKINVENPIEKQINEIITSILSTVNTLDTGKEKNE